ncbi:DNA internalization-related competence protein ComEC/Rec2 [Hylemonella gracilis]|uniref:DNA internalization-related competence protein ComEC/Rec2 n=1 Tax=Hylemonella gracilis TaxID=80880 RepID=UPI0026C3F3F5
MSAPLATPANPTSPPPAAGYARLLTPVLLGWLAGIAAQLQQGKLWPLASYGLLAASGLALLIASVVSLTSRVPGTSTPAARTQTDLPFAGPLLALLAAALLAYASTGLRALHLQTQALAPVLEGRDLTLTGHIAAMPQRTDNGTRFLFEVESAALFEQGRVAPLPGSLHVPERLMLTWYGAWRDDNGALLEPFIQAPDLQAGERWRFNARLRAVHGARNPHGFDYELWMWEQGLQASGYVRTTHRDPVPALLTPNPPWWAAPYRVEQARQQVRDAIVRRAPAYTPVLPLSRAATAAARTPAEFEPPTARPTEMTAPTQAADMATDPAQDRAEAMNRRNAYGVVAALVTGDQQAIARADWDVFRTTGVAHLMSISGLHITLFAWLAAALVSALWRYTPLLGAQLCLRWPASQAGLLGGLLLATAYALFSGWGVPAQRTVLMLAVVTLLRLTGRRWPWPQLWLAAAAIVLAVSPWAWLQAGFWLSFVAVGVLFANGRSDEGRAPSARDATPKVHRRLAALAGGVLRPLWHLLREQGVVTLALAPLTLLFFGQMSLVSLLANLVAIPWVTLVVTPLALLGTLGVAAEPLAPYSAPLWDAAAWAVQWLNTLLAGLAELPLAVYSAPQAPMWAALAGALGGLLLVLRLPWSLRLAGLPLLLPVLLWQPPAPAQGEFELLAADVGQGQAVLVRTARHALLYDAGPRYTNESDAGERVLVPLLRALGVRLDALLLSHRDADHAGGAAAVLTAHPRAVLLSSLDAAHELRTGRQALRCEAGQSWEWDGVRFDILHPRATDYGLIAGRTPRANTVSCVLRVRAATPRAPALAPRCWSATLKKCRNCAWRRRPRKTRTGWPQTCCSYRTTAARPPAPKSSWTLWPRTSPWSRRVTATAMATPRRKCCRGMARAASPCTTARAAARQPGGPTRRVNCAVNGWPIPVTGSTGIERSLRQIKKTD